MITHYKIHCIHRVPPNKLSAMPTKLASEYWSMTTQELKHTLNREGCNVSGRKPQLIGRLMIHNLRFRINNFSIVHDNINYKPTKKEKKFGIVTNLPLGFQEKICDCLAEKLYCYYKSKYFWDAQGNPAHELLENPRKEITHCLRQGLKYGTGFIFCRDIGEEVRAYTGNISKNLWSNTNYENWTWERDDKGRSIFELIVDIVVEMWEESVQNYQKEKSLYGNPQWVFTNPFIDIIPETVRNLVHKKHEKILKRERVKRVLTFLHGCNTETSNSTLLKFNGHGPIRKQIAQYIDTT